MSLIFVNPIFGDISMKIIKPMLAETLEIENDSQLENLKYPVLGTPKLDGIRCLKIDDNVLSRKFKEIPNNHVQKMMKDFERQCFLFP